MGNLDTEKLAQAWIDFQKNWWAWDKLDEYCRKDSKTAWSVLTALTQLADTDELLEDIGVGPLEDFINYYAEEQITEIELLAAQSRSLQIALSHVSVRDSEHPLAERLAKLGCTIASSKGPSRN